MSLLPLLFLAAAATLAPAEQAAVYKAAGLVNAAGRPTTCASAEPSWPKSDLGIESVDLNGDGKPEVFVTESNAACYGNTGMAFTIVARDAGGTWRRVGGSVGVPAALSTRQKGWADIEVGGPGFGRMPVMRWTGSAYGEPR